MWPELPLLTPSSICNSRASGASSDSCIFTTECSPSCDSTGLDPPASMSLDAGRGAGRGIRTSLVDRFLRLCSGSCDELAAGERTWPSMSASSRAPVWAILSRGPAIRAERNLEAAPEISELTATAVELIKEVGARGERAKDSVRSTASSNMGAIGEPKLRDRATSAISDSRLRLSKASLSFDSAKRASCAASAKLRSFS